MGIFSLRHPVIRLNKPLSIPPSIVDFPSDDLSIESDLDSTVSDISSRIIEEEVVAQKALEKAAIRVYTPDEEEEDKF